MANNKEKNNLTREVLEQLIGETGGDGMPVILAKRYDPQIPTTINLHDYGFEGLTRINRNNKTAWEPNQNFVLVIDGETGQCRVPDTEFNRKRLKRLSQESKSTVKRVILEEDGKTSTVDEEVTIPATYRMMDQNLAQSTLVDTVAARVMAMMKQGISEDTDAVPVPTSRPRGRRAPDPKDEEGLLDPIK